jgi:DNA-binding beta-propeller fold protein YncE
VLFTAYRLYPDGKMASFGRPGSAPGRFNIVSGIVTDDQGNYLIVDKLKCTVMVFDKNYQYLTQFGFRGFKPGNLIAPDQIAIDKSNRVYVTQNGRRGVSVYKVTHD